MKQKPQKSYNTAMSKMFSKHHPTFSEQEFKYNATLEQFLSVNSVDSTRLELLLANNLQLESCRKFEESGGVINSIFMIRAKRFHTTTEEVINSSSIDLVLRISNIHEYWKGISVRNEVACIELAGQAGIPVPTIVAYSANAEQSPLGCEFILQERVEGETLDIAWKKLTTRQKQQVLEQLVLIVGKLHTIPKSEMLMKEQFLVGSLLKSEESRSDQLGPVVGDCAPLGPFRNLKEMVIEHLDFALNQISNEKEQIHYPHYVDFVTSHSKPLLELRNKLSEQDDSMEDESVYQFCHCDLNASNIMVKYSDDRVVSNCSSSLVEVTAILDWPQSRFTSMVMECETLAHWACLLEMLETIQNDHENQTVSTESLDNMCTNFEEEQVRSKVMEWIVPIWERNGIVVHMSPHLRGIKCI